MNLGGINQLDKDTDASFQDWSDKEDDDTSVESDSRSVDDSDLAAGAILVPDFKNNPDQDDIIATPWGKEHYLKYFPCQTRLRDVGIGPASPAFAGPLFPSTFFF